jgi:hypothetical protein
MVFVVPHFGCHIYMIYFYVFWIGVLNLEDALILIHNIYKIVVFWSK